MSKCKWPNGKLPVNGPSPRPQPNLNYSSEEYKQRNTMLTSGVETSKIRTEVLNRMHQVSRPGTFDFTFSPWVVLKNSPRICDGFNPEFDIPDFSLLFLKIIPNGIGPVSGRLGTRAVPWAFLHTLLIDRRVAAAVLFGSVRAGYASGSGPGAGGSWGSSSAGSREL